MKFSALRETSLDGSKTSSETTLNTPIVGLGATLLFFTEPPTSAQTGLNFSFSPVVRLLDAAGNVATSDSRTITLQAYSNSGCTTAASGTLSGTLTVASVNGVASFGSISFANSNPDVTEFVHLKAFAAGLTSACSNLIKVTSYKALLLSHSPLSYWRLDETSGATAANSGPGPNGAYIGGYVLGINPAALWNDPNQAVRLDGSTGHVKVLADATFDFSSSFSIEAWVNPSSTSPGAKGIISKWGSTNAQQYSLEMDGTKVKFIVMQSSATSVFVEHLTALTANTWTHVAGVANGPGNTISLYINGALASTAAYTGSTMASPLYFSNIGIGVNYDGAASNAPMPGTYLFGFIDEVAIFNRVLSSSEVNQHFNAGAFAVFP